jgi:ribosomal protein S12
MALFLGKSLSKPNSPTRPLEKLSESNSKGTALFPHDGSLKLVNENDRVLIREMGWSGMWIGALPGVCFKVIQVAGFSLDGCFGKKEKLAGE